MSISQKRIADWMGVAKDAAQVIALLGVGLWTLFVYLKTEGPSAAGQLVTKSELVSARLQDGGCELQFQFTVENNGKTSAAIERVRVRAWDLDKVTATTEKTKILSGRDLQAGDLIDDRGFSQSILLAWIP